MVRGSVKGCKKGVDGHKMRCEAEVIKDLKKRHTW